MNQRRGRRGMERSFSKLLRPSTLKRSYKQKQKNKQTATFPKETTFKVSKGASWNDASTLLFYKSRFSNNYDLSVSISHHYKNLIMLGHHLAEIVLTSNYLYRRQFEKLFITYFLESSQCIRSLLTFWFVFVTKSTTVLKSSIWSLTSISERFSQDLKSFNHSFRNCFASAIR